MTHCRARVTEEVSTVVLEGEIDPAALLALSIDGLELYLSAPRRLSPANLAVQPAAVA